jgi:uncharacterized protein (DUF488 family)
MRRLICTIGFTGKTAEEFFELLEQASVEQVVDIRLNRGGQLAGFAKHPDLAYFLAKIHGIRYLHEPLLAPEAELLSSYRKNKDWPAYEERFLALMKGRGVPQAVDTSGWPAKIALLCSEPGPEKCHRRLVADVLAEHWGNTGGAEIRHLVSSNYKAKKQGRKKRAAAP